MVSRSPPEESHEGWKGWPRKSLMQLDPTCFRSPVSRSTRQVSYRWRIVWQ